MELSSSKIKKFLIFREMKISSSNIKKFLIFSQKKAFLIFLETEFSYISGNGNPEKLPYISSGKVHWEPWHSGTFLYFGKGIFRTLAYLELAYSLSNNLTLAISRVLIGQHFIFCSPTWPTCCNSPRKCTPVKYKVRQKAGFPIVSQTTS